MRCRGQLSDVLAALLVGAVMLPSVWAAKHSGMRMDAATMLWVDAAAGAAYLVLQRVLAQR
jgi:hypothetical protein